DIVAVRPGLYQESIVIDRQISLSGSGAPGAVRVEAKGKPVLTSTVEHAEVSGIEFIHSQGEIAVDPRGRVLSLEECVISADSEVAIIARKEAALIARGCTIRNAGGAGVLVYESGRAELSGCTVT